ncbi:MAG: TatD family hydrolase [Desulfobacter sp.]|nr:TatD family hydrolase [Desulfobacter sp.]WDP85130.1 MAG: TatD family hydrolase [Desulfobacter sp.]
MNFIDVHTHLHDKRIIDHVPEMIRRARSCGLKFMVTCATMAKNFESTAKLAETHGDVLPCFGVHPWFLDTLEPCWEMNLASWLDKMPSGVGEIGLDFSDKGSDRDFQIRVFNAQMALASDLNRPVSIHIRHAWDAFIHILKKNGPLKNKGLVHSFSGSADLVRILEKYNLHISFSGAVTRPNAKKTIKALNAVSLDRILFETDAPDILPSLGNDEKVFDRLNHPANLPGIVRIAAQHRKMGFEKLADLSYTNGLNLFNSIIL